MPTQVLADHAYARSEFDWLASDRNGYLGFFSTAGAGPIPRAVAFSPADYEAVLEQVLALPKRAEAKVERDNDRNIDEWIAISQRGFFAFDWRWESSSYEIVAAPSIPARVTDLPESGLSELAIRTVLDADLCAVRVFVVTAAGLEARR